MTMSRGFFFFCFSLFETTEVCLGCTKMEVFGENFLTSPTFDCTHGYAPGDNMIWFEWGCATQALKLKPIFKGHFGRKGTHF